MPKSTVPKPDRPPGRVVPRPFALPWGTGQVVEEVSVLRPHWEPTIQLLQYEDGSQGLRFCYYHGARFGRGPTILDDEAVEEFSDALETAPHIRALLRRMVDGRRRREGGKR